jgi:RNA polymerase sigma factor (sigma-70 family)
MIGRVRRRTVDALKDATDEELLAACLRGEAAGWDALLDRYSALIYSIAIKYGLPDPDAADVFQSVCLTVLEKLDTIRAPKSLGAWIITTTSRQCLAWTRRRRREQTHRGARDPDHEGDTPDPDPLPEQELLALERQRIVRAAVERLPANCRKLLGALFSDAQQATYRQLAEGVGIAVNSLGPTRARCLERLRRLLDDAGYFG